MTGKRIVVDVLKGETVFPPPLWMMRQAGRYLPEYRETRKQAGTFLDLCYNPDRAVEVTLQPIERFGFDASILFSDILVVPHALGRDLSFEEGRGPVLTPITAAQIPDLNAEMFHVNLAPVYETVRTLRRKLPDETALIGFCGAPWTVATYMIAGHGTPDQAPARLFAYREPQAFARLRQQYNQHDDWIINLLMDGISIPEQAFKQPMLIGEKTTIFGMAKRYASDAANLTESVVNGATYLDLSVQVPRIGTGGVIMIMAEVTPDQLFERQEDPFLHTASVEQLPEYLRDTLDPEKVDIVQNERIDVDHATPKGTFGFEPMNARWNINSPRIGGKFYRPKVNAGFDEDRQRIWAVETLNPTLSTDFYLCTNMHTKPFVVTNKDPFECVTQGEIFIEGNTVFGGHLIEATDDYEKVLAVAPQDRIEKP